MRNLKPLKSIYTFHRGLKNVSKVSCHRPTAVPGGRERGGGGLRWGDGVEVVLNNSTNRYTGRFRPEVQPLTFLYTSFVRKKVPHFVYILLTNSTPHMPSLKFKVADNVLSLKHE